MTTPLPLTVPALTPRRRVLVLLALALPCAWLALYALVGEWFRATVVFFLLWGALRVGMELPHGVIPDAPE